MPHRRQVVIGNWKMNGSFASNAALLAALLPALQSRCVAPAAAQAAARGDACEVAVCVPFVYVAQAAAALRGSAIGLGAQDVSEFGAGAYTGETAASMLVDCGCRYVLVGHSERRTWFGDTDERVALKAQAALGAGLVPVVCVGETLEEREQGRAEAVVKRQLDAVTGQIGSIGLASIVVAYEPVWAIGTGRTATPDEAQAMHAMIRRHVSTTSESAATLKILYGGSVKAANAASLFGCDDIDGGLIGGASLVADDFIGIVAAANGAADSAITSGARVAA